MRFRCFSSCVCEGHELNRNAEWNVHRTIDRAGSVSHGIVEGDGADLRSAGQPRRTEIHERRGIEFVLAVRGVSIVSSDFSIRGSVGGQSRTTTAEGEFPANCDFATGGEELIRTASPGDIDTGPNPLAKYVTKRILHGKAFRPT